MANRVITQVPVDASGVRTLILEPRPDPLDGSKTVIYCTVMYDVRDASARAIASRTATLPLTAPQQAAIATFVANTVVPALNAAEGT